LPATSGVAKVAAVSDAPARKRRRARSGGRVVALVGVHGAPGAALMRRLDDDDRVSRLVLVDRYGPALPLRKASFVSVDLTATLADAALAEMLARERVQSVVHAAFDDAPVRNVEAAHELEVIGTRALLRALADDARRGGSVESLVVLGSTMSYGALPDNPQYLRESAPLRAARYPFVTDKVAVEEEIARFRTRTGMPTAMLRACWTVGDPSTLAARLLAPLFVPAVLGADPLVQLLHLEDLVHAVRLAVHGRHDGCFNLAGDGVLPLSTIIKLAGRLRAAALRATLRASLHALWVAGIGVVPAAHAAYLRETFVADVAHAVEVLGFRARYSTRDALARHVAARRGAHLAAA
jgi:UDP-glucose 4-epimerase